MANRSHDAATRLAALQSSRSAKATDRTEVLNPPPHLRGAPQEAAWKNPTIWLFVATMALATTGWIGYLTSSLSTVVVIALNTLAGYFAFTVLHESVHRTAHANRAVNDALGWLPALMLGQTFQFYRGSHLQHHAHTNDPERDPDHHVARKPGWLLPFWLFTTPYKYRTMDREQGTSSSTTRSLQVALDLFFWLSIPIALLTGVTTFVVVLIVIPAMISGMFLFYAFDYLPHKPHTSTERFYDTRIQPGAARHSILLGQNYHLIHHLWVSVPWFRYRSVYTALETELKAKNIRIG